MSRDDPRRIPLHDHLDGNSGGKLAASATATTAASGGSSSSGGTSTDPLTVTDEGTNTGDPATSIDFVGALVAATGSGPGKTITISSPALDDLTDVTIASPTLAQFLRYSGSVWLNAALIVSDYPYHSETLCDSAGPILQSNGDVITVVVVPN